MKCLTDLEGKRVIAKILNSVHKEDYFYTEYRGVVSVIDGNMIRIGINECESITTGQSDWVIHKPVWLNITSHNFVDILELD